MLGSHQSSNSRSLRSNAQPRRKACQQCSDHKNRCDLRRPKCSRCQTRGNPCTYLFESNVDPVDTDPVFASVETHLSEDRVASAEQPLSHSISQSTPSNSLGRDIPAQLATPTHGGAPAAPTLMTSPSSSRPPLHAEHHGEPAARSLVPADLDLVPSADSTRIGSRWLDSFLPSPNRIIKDISARTALYITRVLKTFPRKMLRTGSLPPMIHPLQLAGDLHPVPLVNCLSLVRMWEGRARGSEAIITQILSMEMQRLYQELQSYDQMDLLAAAQAYLIYSIMGFFWSDEGFTLTDGQTMIKLQEFGSRIAATGLVCAAELHHARPAWEPWVVAEARRRTLYTMYMFDNVFNFMNNTPSYLAEELGNLPAASSKALWDASKREVWQREYDIHLAEWEGGGFKLGELWPPKPETDTAQRSERIEKWGASLDEFGMMLFVVCTLTHGG